MRARYLITAVLSAGLVVLLTSASLGAASSAVGNPMKVNKVLAHAGVSSLMFSETEGPTTKTIPGASMAVGVPSAWANGGVLVARFGTEQIQRLNAGDCEIEIRIDGQEVSPDADVALSLGSNVQRHLFLERYATLPSGPHKIGAAIAVNVGGADNSAEVTGWILEVTLSRAR